MRDFLVNLNSTITLIAKDISELRCRTGQLINLTTTDKTNLVNAINELKILIESINLEDIIDDTLSDSLVKTYSINKIKITIQEAIDTLVDGAPVDLNTLNKLALAIQNIDNNIIAILTELDDKVAYSTQVKTTLEKTTARANIGAVGVGEDISENNVNLESGYTNIGTTVGNKQNNFNSKVDLFVGNVGDLTMDFLSEYNLAAGN